MRQMRALNRQRLSTWQFMRIEAVDRLGRFDSFGVVAQMYADYLAWADRQSDGVWTPIHRRIFDVFVRSHVQIRRGRAIGWALKPPCSPP